jgi:hypothetical protein
VCDEVLLTVAGLQDPVIPFVDVLGNAGAAEPMQIAGIAVKVGVIVPVVVTVIVPFAVEVQAPPVVVMV